MLVSRSPISRLHSRIANKPDGHPNAGDLPQGTITVSPIKSPVESLTHKPEALERPVILINGLARDAHDWDKLVPWLTSNSQNEFGGVYKKGQDDQFASTVKDNPDAKVFVLDPSNNLASPRVLGGELRRMIDHVLRETGQKKVDLVGHSQGGLDILAALDQGEDRVEKVVTLATPWQGAAVASVARRFDGFAGGNLGGVLAPVGKDQGALLDLRPLEKNEWLKGAHSRWKARPEKPEVTSISGSGTPTPGGQEGAKLTAGDGFVSIQSGLGLPESHNYHLAPGQWDPGDQNFRAFHSLDVNHLGIAGNSTAFKTLGEVLAEKVVPPAESPQDKQPSPKPPAEATLDQAEDLVHDHLRADFKKAFAPWVPVLDEIQDVRQVLVESDIRSRAAELKQSRAKWIVGAGLVTGAVGYCLAGTLGALPGAAATLVGGYRMWDGAAAQKSELLAQHDAAQLAVHLKDRVEAELN